MRAITDTIIAYKLIWFRVSCYFLVPFCVTFLALTETWSGDTWQNTHWFLIGRLLVSCVVAGLTPLIAFIDSSLQRANQQAEVLKEKRDTETQFLRKDAPNG